MRQSKLKLVVDHVPVGPSERFVKLTRNPALASPARFEPTTKGENDVVI